MYANNPNNIHSNFQTEKDYLILHECCTWQFLRMFAWFPAVIVYVGHCLGLSSWEIDCFSCLFISGTKSLFFQIKTTVIFLQKSCTSDLDNQIILILSFMFQSTTSQNTNSKSNSNSAVYFCFIIKNTQLFTIILIDRLKVPVHLDYRPSEMISVLYVKMKLTGWVTVTVRTWAFLECSINAYPYSLSSNGSNFHLSVLLKEL